MQGWRAAVCVLLLTAAQGALAAPDTEAVLGEIGAALGAGDGATTVRLASAALTAGNLSEAEQAQLLLNRGLGQELRGAHDAALADFTAAAAKRALAPLMQAHVLFDRGVALEELNRGGEALADYDAAIKLAPKFASPLNNRANILRRQGRAAEARRDYMAALAAVNLHPEFSYFGLGQLAETVGDPEAARAFYAHAVAANPAYGEARERLTALDTAEDAPITLKPPPGALPGRVALTPPQTVQLHPPRPRPQELPGTALRSPLRAALRPAPPLRPALNDAPANKPVQGPQIQLGAWRSEAEARQGWNRAQRLAPGLLQALSPRTVPVDLPGRGRYYRLRVAGAADLCRQLEVQGVECMAVRD